MVSTHLKNMSQIGNLPQFSGCKSNVWNHHLELGNWGYKPYKGSLGLYSHHLKKLPESGLQHRLEPQHLAPSDLWMDPKVGKTRRQAPKLQKNYRNSWPLVFQNNQKKHQKTVVTKVNVDVTNVIQLSGDAKLSHHKSRIFWPKYLHMYF